MAATSPVSILCVTPNVAIDRTHTVPGFAIGGVFRAQAVSVMVGGKGVNVARAACRLGHRVTAAGMLAGHAGRHAADLAITEGLEGHWTWIAGETRTCLIVTDGHGSTVMNEPGPVIADDDWRSFVEDVGTVVAQADVAVISGSLPPGVARGGLSDLIFAAHGGHGPHGAAVAPRPVWVDTHGEPLMEAIDAGPFAIKVNGDEIAAMLGGPVADAPAALAAARHLRAEGIAVACITLGAAGAVLMCRQGAWHAEPPAIAAVNPTGAGDCFFGALATAWTAGADPAEALRLATAVGAADCLQASAAQFTPADVGRLAADVRVHQVA